MPFDENGKYRIPTVEEIFGTAEKIASAVNGHEQGAMRTPEQVTVAAAIESILHSCNADMTDPNFTETPMRVAKAFTDYWLSGYSQQIEDVLTVFPNEGEG